MPYKLLLTDEEMELVYNFEEVAKAQLKKVGGYIFGECPHGYGERLVCGSCIKALRDEVKDATE